VFGNSSAEKLDVRDKDIVAYQLNPFAEFCGEFFPAGPIIFGATVLNRNDRKPRTKIRIVLDEFSGGFF